MFVEICRPCPFFYESTILEGKAKRPDCKIGKQSTCLSAATIYLSDQDRIAKLRILPISEKELNFLKMLLDFFVSSIDWPKGSPFESIADVFPKGEFIWITDGLLHRIEKLVGA
jgi:hypothetical protein